MKKVSIYFSAFFTSALLCLNTLAQTPTAFQGGIQSSEKAVEPKSKALPNVLILATGGTIAGAAKSGAQAAYTSGQVTIDAMINAIPEVTKIATIKGEQIANVGSQDMSFDIMIKLANRINQAAKDNTNVDGFVITHGTDTMEETAYFLNLVVKTDKPVVLVGSMRPSTAISADGPLNLYDAIAVAADPNAKNRGVLLVMNDWIHSAQTLTKVSTTAVQTFMSPIRGLIGTTAYGVNEYYRYPAQRYGEKSEFSIDGVTKLPRVDIIYADADMSPDLIDASVKLGAKGIVIAGVGNGNMNKVALDACARASKQGVVVVRSTRVATGNVSRNVEVNDDQLGLVASYGLNPQKSRILLSVALLKARKLDEMQRIFMEY